jgi:hypothetical protein
VTAWAGRFGADTLTFSPLNKLRYIMRLAFLSPVGLILGLMCMATFVAVVAAVVVLLVVKLTQRNAGPTNPNLRPCPDCGRMVSTSAQSCPGCGKPLAG